MVKNQSLSQLKREVRALRRQLAQQSILIAHNERNKGDAGHSRPQAIDSHSTPGIEFWPSTIQRLSGANVQSLLTTLFDSAPVGVVIIQAGRFLHGNPVGLQILGYPDRGELVGQSLEAVIPADARALLLEVNRYREQGADLLSEYELNVLRKDGTVVPVEIKVTVIQLSGGPASVVFFTPIPKDSPAERRLAELNHLNQLIVANSCMGIYAYKASGPCVLANEAGAEMLHARLHQVLRQDYTQIESWRTSGLLEVARRTLETNQPQRQEIHLVTSFGHEVWLDCCMTQFLSHGEIHLLLIANNITEWRRSELALKGSERQFRTLLEHSPDIVVALDADNQITYISPSVEATLGFTTDEVLANPSLLHIKSEDRPLIQNAYLRLKEHPNEDVRMDLRIRHRDGSYRWLEVHATHLTNEAGAETLMMNLNDITERKQREKDLDYTSTHDALTGLYNRAYFNQELSHLESEPEVSVLLMVADLDNLKTTNDSQGHLVGDERIQALADFLLSIFREGDIVARIGGDEFAVIIAEAQPGLKDEVTQRIAARDGEQPAVGFSYGMAYRREGEGLLNALKRADDQMYAQKIAKKQAA